jgi:hypothetical protein
MRKLILPTLSILISCAFISCQHCVEGSNRPLSEDRTGQIHDFTEIESNGDFDVELVQDTVTSVFVDADDNIVPYISTFTSGRRLVLEYKSNKCFQPHERSVITVYVPAVTKIIQNGSGSITCDNLYVENSIDIQLSGSGDIYIRNLNAEDVYANASGSGDITLTGDANYSRNYMSGSGLIDAYRLYVHESDAIMTGSGSIYVRFLDWLKVDISGSGDVHYRGNRRDVSITGGGSGEVYDDTY